MKKYFLTTLILAFTAQIYAQNNLVFNQVILLELTSSGTTVPEGKVWKVQDGSGGYVYLVNGETWIVGGSGSYKSTPTWFPEGSVFTRFNGSNRLSFLSILEFNLVDASTGSGGGSGTTTSTNDFNNPGGGTSWGDDYTPGESVTDIDGNVYETVTIGPQTWTTSNLNVSTYRDGTPIPHITDWQEWQNATTGAYTYIAQNESEARGKVYNVWAVMGRNDQDPNTPLKELAPDGFHIPSVDEWNALINFFGGTGTNAPGGSSAINFLKSETGWLYESNGNNESGLNIYPTGHIASTSSGMATGTGFSTDYDTNEMLSRTYFFSKTNSNFSFVGYHTISIQDIHRLGWSSIESIGYNYPDGTLYSNGNGGAFIRLIKN